MKAALAVLTLLLFSACGPNPDRGLVTNKDGKRTASSVTTGTTTTTTVSTLEFGSCRILTVYNGTDPSFAQQLAGTQACPGVSNRSMVRVKAGSTLPANTRVCLVPIGAISYTASCFALDYQKELTLTTNEWSAVALVKEGDVAAYMSFANGQSSTYPAMAFGTIR